MGHGVNRQSHLQARPGCGARLSSVSRQVPWDVTTLARSAPLAPLGMPGLGVAVPALQAVATRGRSQGPRSRALLLQPLGPSSLAAGPVLAVVVLPAAVTAAGFPAAAGPAPAAPLMVVQAAAAVLVALVATGAMPPQLSVGE